MPSALRIKELRNLSDNVLLNNGTLTNNVVFPAHHIIKIQQNHVDVPISLPSVSAYSQAEVTNMRTDFAVGSGNKVLIMLSLSVCSSYVDSVRGVGSILLADGSAIGIGSATGLGNNRQMGAANSFGVGGTQGRINQQFLYTPGTTNSVQYSVKIDNKNSTSETLYVNRSAVSGHNHYYHDTSTITLMEIVG